MMNRHDMVWRTVMIAACEGGGSAPGTTPNAFSFTNRSKILPSTVYDSTNNITVSGLGTGVSAPVSITNGAYTKNGAAYTSAPGTAMNGDTFYVEHTSAATLGTATNTVLTIGTVSGTFTSTTYTSAGAEMWPQPAFDASTGLALTHCSVTGGKLVFDNSGLATNCIATYAGGTFTQGETYMYSFDSVGLVVGDAVQIRIGGASGIYGSLSTDGTKTGTIDLTGTVTAQTIALRIAVNDSGVITLDNFSIKKLS